MKDNNLFSDFNNKENSKDNNNNKAIKKRKLSKFEKDIIKLNYLSNLKINKNIIAQKNYMKKILLVIC